MTKELDELRDMFAGMAMMGFLSHGVETHPNDDISSIEIIARSSYAIANAMLEERKRTMKKGK